MEFYRYKIGKGAIQTLNHLLPRVQKQNCAAAAVMLLGKTPVLRRGRGAGKLIRLDVELWIQQDTTRSLSFSWPNNEGTPPLLLAFSLQGCVDGAKAMNAEHLVIFDPECDDSEQVQTIFVSNDENTEAHGYVYIVEEGANGSQIAWFVFINQTKAGNHTVTRFGSPEALAPLAESVSRGMQLVPRNSSDNVFFQKGGASGED